MRTLRQTIDAVMAEQPAEEHELRYAVAVLQRAVLGLEQRLDEAAQQLEHGDEMQRGLMASNCRRVLRKLPELLDMTADELAELGVQARRRERRSCRRRDR